MAYNGLVMSGEGRTCPMAIKDAETKAANSCDTGLNCIVKNDQWVCSELKSKYQPNPRKNCHVQIYYSCRDEYQGATDPKLD